MLPKLVALVASLTLFGCGGTVMLDDNASDPLPLAAPADQISLIAHDAAPPPTACVACTVNADCGPAGAACVWSADGSGFCAPGCNKEGFCTPDRACQWVTDPEGQAWRACVPYVRESCAPPDLPPARVSTAHPGTW